MKHLTFFILSLLTFSSKAQDHQLVKIWETDTLAVPESVLPDIPNNTLFVSLIDGAPWEVDGKGGIAKLDLNGKIIHADWVTGLNAPKGLGKFKNTLYVADVTAVIVIDIPTGKIVGRINFDSAEALNDLTVDKNGVVYVSDSRLGRIYRLKNGKTELYIPDLKGANGVKAVGDDLYAISGPSMVKIDKDKNITKVTDGFAKGGDGIEPVGNGDFIATCWPGLIYYVKKDGSNQLLLDSQALKMNTADIGFYQEKNILYLPTFNKKSVIAYQLK